MPTVVPEFWQLLPGVVPLVCGLFLSWAELGVCWVLLPLLATGYEVRETLLEWISKLFYPYPCFNNPNMCLRVTKQEFFCNVHFAPRASGMFVMPCEEAFVSSGSIPQVPQLERWGVLVARGSSLQPPDTDWTIKSEFPLSAVETCSRYATNRTDLTTPTRNSVQICTHFLVNRIGHCFEEQSAVDKLVWCMQDYAEQKRTDQLVPLRLDARDIKSNAAQNRCFIHCHCKC